FPGAPLIAVPPRIPLPPAEYRLRRQEPAILASDRSGSFEFADQHVRQFRGSQPEVLAVEIAIKADAIEIGRHVGERQVLAVEQREDEVHLECMARDTQAIRLECGDALTRAFERARNVGTRLAVTWDRNADGVSHHHLSG